MRYKYALSRSGMYKMLGESCNKTNLGQRELTKVSGISILRYLNVHVEIFRALEMVACFMLQKNK